MGKSNVIINVNQQNIALTLQDTFGKTETQVRTAIKNNLKQLINNGVLQYYLKEIEKYFNAPKEFKKFHNQSISKQFSGAALSYITDRQYYTLKRKQFEKNHMAIYQIQHLLNKIRSLLLNLPELTYGVAIQNENGIFYLKDTTKTNLPKNLLSLIMNEDDIKTRSRVRGVISKEQTKTIEEILKEDMLLIEMSIHFSNMIRAMKEWNPHREEEKTPSLSYAAQTYQQHLQSYRQTTLEQLQQENSNNSWSQHSISEVWKTYHHLSPKWDDEGNLIGKNPNRWNQATLTQGGDIGQVQVKSFTFRSRANVMNFNVLEDTFTFLQQINEDSLNPKNIDQTVLKIMSVFYSYDTLKEMGYVTAKKVRDKILTFGN